MNHRMKLFFLKKNYILSLVSVMGSLGVISGCMVVSYRKPPVPAAPNVRSEFNQIQIESAAGASHKSISRLKKLIAAHPHTDVAYDAYMILGKIYFKNKDYLLAYNAFNAVVTSDTLSPAEGEALLWAGKSLHRLGRQDEALALTLRSIRIPGLSDELKVENYKLRFLILSELGDRIEALKALVFIADKDPDLKSRESYKLRAFDFVESRLTDQDCEDVSKSNEFGFVRGVAQYKVAVRAFEQRDFLKAREGFSSAMNLGLSNDLIERAQNYLRQIESRQQVDSLTVGAVLPLTGKYSTMAQKTLRGLQFGLGIYGPHRSKLKLAVVDSEGHPDGARRAVERLVTEDHVVAIVGSLLSKTATAVATKADELGVPTVALSQKSGLTEIGDTVFRNSLTSEMQVRHLVRSAMEVMGLKKFAILFPNDAYGVEFANLFWDEVLARGGTITAAQPYNSNENDFSGPIQRLVGQYYVEDRIKEYKSRLVDWYKKQKSVNVRQKPPDELLPPIVTFDAIFIPDGFKALNQIAPTLAFYDVQNVKLLGTNLWNSDELAQRADKHVEGALFVDSFLSSDTGFLNTDFYKDFQRIFGEPPGPFEIQAYDTGLILRQILVSGRRNRVDLMEQLNEIRDFPGALGKMNFSSPREFSRPIETLTISGGKIVRWSSSTHP